MRTPTDLGKAWRRSIWVAMLCATYLAAAVIGTQLARVTH